VRKLYAVIDQTGWVSSNEDWEIYCEHSKKLYSNSKHINML